MYNVLTMPEIIQDCNMYNVLTMQVTIQDCTELMHTGTIDCHSNTAKGAHVPLGRLTVANAGSAVT